jgi:hypothetical protein
VTGIVAALTLTTLTATAASASTWGVYSQNNYADASGSIFYCDNQVTGTCFPDADFKVTVELTDTVRYNSSSYVYLTYRDWDRKAHRILLASAGNGRTVKTSRWVAGRPWFAQITVCTKRGTGWYCGNPSVA